MTIDRRHPSPVRTARDIEIAESDGSWKYAEGGETILEGAIYAPAMKNGRPVAYQGQELVFDFGH